MTSARLKTGRFSTCGGCGQNRTDPHNATTHNDMTNRRLRKPVPGKTGGDEDIRPKRSGPGGHSEGCWLAGAKQISQDCERKPCARAPDPPETPVRTWLLTLIRTWIPEAPRLASSSRPRARAALIIAICLSPDNPSVPIRNRVGRTGVSPVRQRRHTRLTGRGSHRDSAFHALIRTWSDRCS